MKLLIVLLFPFFSYSQIKLEKINLLDNKLEILIPKQLSVMSEEMWTLKYKRNIRPILVLTDEEGEVNFLADDTQIASTENGIDSFKNFHINSMKEKRPDLEFLEDGIKTINGIKVGYFKFLSQAIDQKVFNYYFFIVIEEKIILFSFNCIEKLQSTWEKSADEIVSSIFIKS